jgi:hypothetical protein
MLAEPEYTKGHSNTVMWNMLGSGIYQYQVQISTDSEFSSIKEQSNWVSTSSYEFKNLQNGKMYFYRVRARNAFGALSNWSNVVFSVQDAEPPEVTLISVSDTQGNSNVNWDRNFTINIRYRITDNVGISRREFWCIDSNNDRHDCLHTATLDGDFYDISIQLKYLEKTASGSLFAQYRFCAEASDTVNNVTRNCEAKIEIYVETPEEEIPPPVIPRVPVITRIRERLEKIFDDTLLELDKIDVEDVTVTTTAVNLTVGIGFLLTLLGSLPYFFLQVFFAILTILGLRKEGKVSGYVYNSVTKEPIGQAIVRVYNEVHELVWTSVTDSNGYFRTSEMKDAEYYIKVTARGFTFPSKIVFGKTDFPLDNVYHGDSFLTREEQIPNFSIPMDEEDIASFRKNLASFISRTKYLWRTVHILLLLLGLTLSVYVLTVTDIWWNYLIVLLYIIAITGVVYSFFGKREKYGVVKDEKKNGLEGVVVGLNEKEYGKLISKRVTDSLGRYRFIVNPGKYNLSILNSDIKLVEEEKVSNLEVKKKGGEILAPNIAVKKLEDEVKDDDIIEPLEEL